MKIAVLGWGSLIWCPGCLKIKTRWRKDGPLLPIEFARISSGNRLTLVIHSGVECQRTLWAQSSCESLEEARKNLQEREGTAECRIHVLDKTGCCYGEIPADIKTTIRAWLEEHSDLGAAVWTGLQSNWEEKRSHVFCADDAIQYLKCLKLQKTSKEAREYLRNAPAQIETEVRARAESELKWSACHLTDVLFEEPE